MELEKITLIRPYESVVIMHPDCTLDDQKALFKKNTEIIEAHNGSVNHIDTWGKRTLANEINRLKKGTYFHMTFKADTSAVVELERTMGINDKVLRFFHMRLEDGQDLPKYVEEFKTTLAANLVREKEREAKMREKRASRGSFNRKDS